MSALVDSSRRLPAGRRVPVPDRGLGLVRFPDVLSRMHAGTKPQVLGVLLVMVGGAIRLQGWSATWMLLLVAVVPDAHRAGQRAHDQPGGLPPPARAPRPAAGRRAARRRGPTASTAATSRPTPRRRSRRRRCWEPPRGAGAAARLTLSGGGGRRAAPGASSGGRRGRRAAGPAVRSSVAGRSTVAPASSARATTASTSGTARCRETGGSRSGAGQAELGVLVGQVERARRRRRARRGRCGRRRDRARRPSGRRTPRRTRRWPRGRRGRRGRGSVRGHVARSCPAPESSYRCARFTAETTARSEAVTMLASMPDAPEDAVADGALDVGGGPGVAAGRHARARRSRARGRRRRGCAARRRTRRSGRCRGPRASPGRRRRSARRPSRRAARRAPGAGGRSRREAAPRGVRVGQVLAGEGRPHLRRRSTSPPSSSVCRWMTRAELDLQPARQVEVVLGLHDVGDAALAGLAVHPDHGLVAAADVLGVDRQVRDRPRHLVDGRPGGLRRRPRAP